MACFPRKFPLLFLSILFLMPLEISISAPVRDTARNSLVNKLCASTIDPTYCLNVLRSDQRTAKANLQGLAHISIDLAENKARSTVGLLRSLDRDVGDRDTRFATCSAKYSQVIESLRGARNQLGSGNYLGLCKSASDAMDGTNDCHDEFQVPPPAPTSLYNNNKNMENLCSILYALCNMLYA